MNNQSHSTIHRVVMRRVRTISILQSPLASATFSLGLFTLALWGIGREVWVAHVLRNMPSVTDVGAVFNFYFAAFLNTRSIVQILTLVVLAAGIWFSYGIVRSIRTLTMSALETRAF